MKRKLLPILFLLLTAFVVLYLAHKKDKELFYCPEIVDYIHKYKINPLFEKADNYKYHQDFFSAITAFESILIQNDISNDEKHYAMNQITFCCLSTNQDSLAEVWIKRLEIESDTAYFKDYNKADYFYNKGVSGYRAAKDDANVWFDKALQLYKELYPENHLKLGMAYTQLAMWQYEFGNSLLVAKGYLNDAEKIFENQAIHFKAEFYLAKATLSKFERIGESMEEFCENAKIAIKGNSFFFNDILYARVLIMENFVYRLFCNRKYANDEMKSKYYFHKALDTINKAIQILSSKNHLRTQEAIHNKALVYQNIAQILINKKQYDYDFFRVINNLEECIKKQKKQIFAHPNVLIAFYLSLTDPKNPKKLTSILVGKKEAEKCSWNKVTIFDIIFYILEKHYKQKGDFERALFYNAQNICFYSNKKYSPNIIYNNDVKYGTYYQAIIYKQRGDIYYESFKKVNKPNSLKMAQYCYELADTLLYTNALNYELEVILNLQNEVGNSMYANAIEVSSFIYDKNKSEKALNNIFKYMDRMKSYALSKEIVTTRNNNENLLLQKIKQLNALLNRLRANNNSIEEIEQTKLEISKNYSILRTNMPTIYENLFIQKIPSIKDIQMDLKSKNEALLEYKKADDVLYGLLITKDTVLFHKIIWNSYCDSLLKRYHNFIYYSENMKNDSQKNAFNQCSSKLYKLLIEPFNGILNRKTKIIDKICIIPDKQLNTIPFEALNISKNMKTPNLLINSMTISYSPSWKVWNKNKNYVLSNESNAVFFSYGLSHEKEVLALKASEKEKRALLHFNKQTKCFTKKNCNKDNFSLCVQNSDLIHLSLHALCNENILDSNIIYFGIVNHKLSDELFTYDISKLNKNGGVIILSACETANGNNQYSEGVFSLSRSFLKVGFSNIISTYWKVDDEATGEIMAYFYQYLSEEKNVSSSLRKAKLTFLKNYPQKTNPNYWAGLCLIR